jgi:hypothetical protein
MDLMIVRSSSSIILRTCNFEERPAPLYGDVVAVFPRMAHYAEALLDAFMRDNRLTLHAPLSVILAVMSRAMSDAHGSKESGVRPAAAGPAVAGGA